MDMIMESNSFCIKVALQSIFMCNKTNKKHQMYKQQKCLQNNTQFKSCTLQSLYKTATHIIHNISKCLVYSTDNDGGTSECGEKSCIRTFDEEQTNAVFFLVSFFGQDNMIFSSFQSLMCILLL